MSLHEGYQLGIVDLNTRNRMGNDQRSPERIRGRAVTEYLEDSLNDPEPTVGFKDAESESAAGCDRSGADVPELGDGLRGNDNRVPAGTKCTDRLPDGAVLRVRRGQKPQQDVGVGKDEHQSWSE
jgi:hypothetical protein